MVTRNLQQCVDIEMAFEVRCEAVERVFDPGLVAQARSPRAELGKERPAELVRCKDAVDVCAGDKPVR
jgi:hypothetical protein